MANWKKTTNGKKVFQGIARNVQFQRPGSRESIDILTFRIEQTDSEGNPTRYIPVELRDYQIQGSLVDGDKVEVIGELNRGGINQPEQILNLHTGTYIETYIGDPANLGCYLFGFGLPFLSAIVFGILGLLNIVRFMPTWAGGILQNAFVGFVIGFMAGGFLGLFSMIIYSFLRSTKKSSNRRDSS